MSHACSVAAAAAAAAIASSIDKVQAAVESSSHPAPSEDEEEHSKENVCASDGSCYDEPQLQVDVLKCRGNPVG